MVEAKHLAVFLGVLATSVILVIYISKQPGGYIETRGKSTCSWRTEGDSTTNSRAMLFECQCQNGKEYKCKYEANPDKHCPKFHKDIFGYFKQIREAVAGSEHACDFAEFTIPLCEQSKDFKLRRIGSSFSC